jgi:cobalamin biosynthesis protein CobW
MVSYNNKAINPNVLLGFNVAVKDDFKNSLSHHNKEKDHNHDDNINSVQVILEQEFELKSLVNQLLKIVKTLKIDLIKGFVNVLFKPMRLVLQGVGDRS